MAGIPLSSLPEASSLGNNDLLLVTQSSTSKKVTINTLMGMAQHTYSTSEQVVGTWIDSKPLYEKTYELTNLPSDTNNHVMDATLTKSTVSMKHVQKGFYTLGGAFSGDGFGGDDIYEDNVKSRLRVFCNANGLCYSLQNSYTAITRFVVTVQYTKATD